MEEVKLNHLAEKISKDIRHTDKLIKERKTTSVVLSVSVLFCDLETRKVTICNVGSEEIPVITKEEVVATNEKP